MLTDPRRDRLGEVQYEPRREAIGVMSIKLSKSYLENCLVPEIGPFLVSTVVVIIKLSSCTWKTISVSKLNSTSFSATWRKINRTASGLSLSSSFSKDAVVIVYLFQYILKKVFFNNVGGMNLFY